MRGGTSGPRAVPLAPVLHRGSQGIVLQPELLRPRTAVSDDVAVGERPGSGVLELARLIQVQRGDFFVGEAFDVVDAAVDALDRGVGVGDSVEGIQFQMSKPYAIQYQGLAKFLSCAIFRLLYS